MIHDSLETNELRIRSLHTSVTRSYLYAADMAIWLWRVLLDGQARAIYEVGSPYPVTMMELAREVQRNFNPPPMIYHDPKFQYEPRPYYVPTKAHETMEALGLDVYTPFGAAISKTVRYYQQEAK
jgi:dTDP-glucose 4,6-dehydratase